MNTDTELAVDECQDCVVDASQLPDQMLRRCVRCPFCKETVTAILTSTHISCPNCKVSVEL